MDEIPAWKILVILIAALIFSPIYFVYRFKTKRDAVKKASVSDKVLATGIVENTKVKRVGNE